MIPHIPYSPLLLGLGLGFLSIAALLVAMASGAAWVFLSAAEKRRKGTTLNPTPPIMPNSSDAQYQEVRDRLEQVRSTVGNLPQLPLNPLEYQGWITEVIKRFEMRDQRKTISAFTEVLQGCLKLCQTWGELRRVQATEDLADKQTQADLRLLDKKIAVQEAELDASLLKAHVEKAKAQQEFERITRSGTPGPRSQETTEDRVEREHYAKLDDLDAVERVRAKRHSQYPPGHPMHEVIDRLADDARMRILEGRK